MLHARLTAALATALLAAIACGAGAAGPLSFEDASASLRGDHPEERSRDIGWNGAAWFDFDRDGLLDLFVARGTSQSNALFRNRGDGTFADVASGAGVANGSGSGAAVAGDIDNDGFQDLFLTGARRSRPGGTTAARLYHNRGDGTFADITAASGVAGLRTMVGAAWGDLDRDGLLDLYIGGGEVAAQGSRLFLNNGDGTFADISALAGIDESDGNILGLFSDFDNDGWPDLFAARFSGSQSIALWRNNRDYTFTDVRDEAGLNDIGAWMGWAPGDIDNDGDIDLFLTNYGGAREFLGRLWPHALFLNNGDGTYANRAAATGTGAYEFAWGSTMQDFDNDGFIDLFFAGADPFNEQVGPGWGNPGRLLLNNGPGTDGQATFRDGSEAVPVDLSSHYTSAVAAADYDSDGWVDVAVATESYNGFTTRPVLLRNLGTGGAWLTVELQGTAANRDAVGARVEVESGGLYQVRELYAGSGFLSMDSQRLHFGLDGAAPVDRVRVTWPSGRVQVLEQVDANRHLFLAEPTEAELPLKIRWQRPLPDTAAAGSEVALDALLLLEEEGEARVSADLGRLGGPSEQPLEPLGDGRHRLEIRFTASLENGLSPVLFRIEEAGGQVKTHLEPVALLPAGDLLLFGDELAEDWDFDFGSLRPEPGSEQVFAGESGLTVNSSLGFYDFEFEPDLPVNGFGYELRFAFHPGDVEFTPGTSFKVSFGRRSTLWETQLLLQNGGSAIDLERREWQQVVVPLAPFGADYVVERFFFSGFMRGIFHIDDLRLAALSPAAPTAVVEPLGGAAPAAFALHQNAPNPFNSETVIRFDLERGGEQAALEVYNSAGQRVATLLRGRWPAGTWALRWDGRGDRGERLGSGVYLYRLRTDRADAARKLLILR